MAPPGDRVYLEVMDVIGLDLILRVRVLVQLQPRQGHAGDGAQRPEDGGADGRCHRRAVGRVKAERQLSRPGRMPHLGAALQVSLDLHQAAT